MNAATATLGPVAGDAGLAALDDAVERDRFTRWKDGPGGHAIGESSFQVGGMHCAACSTTLEQALRRVDGVVDAQVSAAAHCATVRWDAARTRPSALVQAIVAAGYTAVPDTAAGARLLRRQESRQALWRLFVAAFCSMQIMMLATPAYVSGAGELAPDLKRLLDWGCWLLALPVLCFSAWPFFAGAWRALARRRIGMDVPVALGIAITFVASTGAAFDPGGPFGAEVYFDSLTMFVAFLLGGRYLELRARHRAAASLEANAGRMPQTVMRVTPDGGVEVVSALRLAPGDVVRVPAGDAFAGDGAVLEGETRVDEALLTGEARPVAKRAGDAVVAGSVNLHAPVVVRVDRVGADTRYEAIVALMREARTHRPDVLRGAERWAAPFLWVVLVLAAGAAAAWSVVDPARAVWVAVSVLIVTCPCALSLAGPSALLAAAGAMARRGVLLRRLDAIEGLARMQSLYVDKTGTLTEARLRCVGMERLDGGAGPGDALLRQYAASLAAWSLHPLSRALAADSEAPRFGWRDVVETPGQGLQALDAEGRCWRLGHAAWAGVPRPAPADAGTCAWLACDGQPRAVFRFDERVRDDAAAGVRALQASGVRVTLLSGDTPERARRLGAALGADASLGGLLPERKLAAVGAAQRRGEIVAMLGDGINDAPVLAQADVSLAMGEGAFVARAGADGVLLSSRLQDVVAARALARRAMRVVRQNIAWAAAYNAACVPLALAGWLPPWAAGLGMAASSLLVLLNSARLGRAQPAAA